MLSALIQKDKGSYHKAGKEKRMELILDRKVREYQKLLERKEELAEATKENNKAK